MTILVRKCAFPKNGRHRGLNTIYIKHNLFHKSTLGRDIELQTTHIALFKLPRDVMQINTLSIQLGLGSSLVHWYRDALMFLLVTCSLIYRREQTIDYVTAQTVERLHQNFTCQRV